MPGLRYASLIILTLAGITISGCGSTEQAAGQGDDAKLQVYDLHGEIVRVEKAEKLLVIKHEEIKGWMDAMTMEYPVEDPADLDRLSPGDRIDAKVHVRGMDYKVAEITVLPAAGPGGTPPSG